MSTAVRVEGKGRLSEGGDSAAPEPLRERRDGAQAPPPTCLTTGPIERTNCTDALESASHPRAHYIISSRLAAEPAAAAVVEAQLEEESYFFPPPGTSRGVARAPRLKTAGARRLSESYGTPSGLPSEELARSSL